MAHMESRSNILSECLYNFRCW